MAGTMQGQHCFYHYGYNIYTCVYLLRTPSLQRVKVLCYHLMFLGIVGVDKTNLSKLGDENDKLRQKLSDVQRENIKLKEVSLSYHVGD